MNRNIGTRLAVFAVLWVILTGNIAVPAQEFRVSSTTVKDTKAVFATVRSVNLAVARTRIGGILRMLRVDEGSAVQAGDVIARVEDPKLPLRIVELNAQIQALKAQLAQGQLDLERAQRLRASGSGSQAQLDAARTQLNVDKGSLAARRAERAVVSEQISEGEVLAPAAGRVLQVPVVNGTAVLAGETVASIAADSYILRLQLPERHARFLKRGDTVLVGQRGLGITAGGLTEGIVRQVYPELDQGRVVADVTVSGLGDYFIGERARVLVATGARQTLIIPQRYLVRRFGVTYAKLKDGLEVVVQPGQPRGKDIEILSGLHPGDRLLPYGR